MHKRRGAGLDVWVVLSDLLETAREGLIRFGTVRPMVVTLWRGKEPDVTAVPKDDPERFYSDLERQTASADCFAVAQFQDQKFTYEGQLLNAVTVSLIAENVGKIGLVQPFHKSREKYSFETPITIGSIAGGLDSADFVWHHVADRWTTIETLDEQFRSLEDAE